MPIKNVQVFNVYQNKSFFDSCSIFKLWVLRVELLLSNVHCKIIEKFSVKRSHSANSHNLTVLGLIAGYIIVEIRDLS